MASPLGVQSNSKILLGFVLILFGAATLLFCIWILPVAGFHHMYVVGIFAWLFVNGEDPDPNSSFYFAGQEFVPTIWGLPINLAATVGIIWIVWRWSRRHLAGNHRMRPEIQRVLRIGSLILSILSIGMGGLGMALSFTFLSSANVADITAGASGFVAGALLVAAGLISLTILSVSGARQTHGTDVSSRVP